MPSNLPYKYNESFINKIKRLLYKLFNKNIPNSNIENVKINQPRPSNSTSDNNCIFNQMLIESQKVHLKEDILNILDNNPNLIQTLSVKQLEELDKMYSKIIEENNRTINKLKRKLA